MCHVTVDCVKVPHFFSQSSTSSSTTNHHILTLFTHVTITTVPPLPSTQCATPAMLPISSQCQPATPCFPFCGYQLPQKYASSHFTHDNTHWAHWWHGQHQWSASFTSCSDDAVPALPHFCCFYPPSATCNANCDAQCVSPAIPLVWHMVCPHAQYTSTNCLLGFIAPTAPPSHSIGMRP